MTLFTFICQRNKQVRSTSVPLPCFWSDAHNKKKRLFFLFVREIPEKMHQTLLSLTACSSVQDHFQKTGQLAPTRRKSKFLADVHIVCIAVFKASGAQVKVEHDLHRNAWKIGVVHTKNAPRKYPTGTPHSLGLK